MEKYTETYGILQTAFRASCINRTSVFEWHKWFKEGGSLWGMMGGVGGVRKSENQSWLAKGLRLGLLCWGFKGIQEEIPSEEASTLQIGSVAFPPGQYTSHNSILVTAYLTKMGIKTVPHRPYSPDLAPCDAWLAQRLSVRDNWGDERGYDEGDWHVHTRGLPWGIPEVVGTVQVHCSRRRIIRRGLEFHVFTVNKSANTKKSGNLFNDHRIYIH